MRVTARWKTEWIILNKRNQRINTKIRLVGWRSVSVMVTYTCSKGNCNSNLTSRRETLCTYVFKISKDYCTQLSTCWNVDKIKSLDEQLRTLWMILVLLVQFTAQTWQELWFHFRSYCCCDLLCTTINTTNRHREPSTFIWTCKSAILALLSLCFRHRQLLRNIFHTYYTGNCFLRTLPGV